jgi:diketogulonate reductase-like aldo/keto reductase
MKKNNQKGNISRRSFLKSSFAIACSVGLAACAKGAETVENIIDGSQSGDGQDDNDSIAGGSDESQNPIDSKVNAFDFQSKSVLLNSGYRMPIIGIGTYYLSTSQAEESVYNALKTGMRLIDTADIYGNETGVARGIKRAMDDFGIKREDIFVTSKLWTSTFYRADEEVNERLQRLELDYVDLLLLHHTAADDEHAYQAMERGVKAGKLHSIGLSNFYEDDVDRMMRIATIPPAILQNETHLYNQSRSVKSHIAQWGTILESWFPLGGRGRGISTLSGLSEVKTIAAAHGKNVYQVLLRWQLQTGNIAIPGSTNATHIQEDYNIFDFELTDDEMKILDGLDRKQRFASY